jgi:hypothetical protein
MMTAQPHGVMEYHDDDAVVGGSCVCEEGIFALWQWSGCLTLLFQEVHRMDAQPRVYYFYLCLKLLKQFATSSERWQHNRSKAQIDNNLAI